MATILRYIPREYMSGNSITRENPLYGPFVDREARGEIPKNAMCKWLTDRTARKLPRGALLVDLGYEKQVKMVFGRVVCRGARSRASDYPGQPAFLISGGQSMGRPVYDGRVETH